MIFVGMNMIVYQLVNEYKGLSEVEAITLAGSGANGRKDNYSDIDIDIIVSKEIDNDRRTQIIKKVSDYMEVGTDYWGAGDEFPEFQRHRRDRPDLLYRTRRVPSRIRRGVQRICR